MKPEGAIEPEAPEQLEELLTKSAATARSSPRSAMRLARRALGIATKSGARLAEGRAHHLIGQAEVFLGNYDAGMERMEHGRRIFAELGDRAWLATSHNGIGALHYRTGDLRNALATLSEGLAIAGEMDILARVMLRGNIALVYRDLGDYEGSLRILLELLAEQDEENHLTRSQLFDSIATVYATLHDLDNCIAYQHRSLDAARRAGYAYGEAMALGNLGAAHNDAGRPREALEFLARALEICRELDDAEGAARALHNIGVSHEAMGEYATALRYLRLALKSDPAGVRTGSRGHSLAMIGAIERKRGEYGAALRSSEKALAIAVAIDDIELEYDMHNQLSLIHEAMGNHPEALRHCREYAAKKERVGSEKMRRAVAELQIRFDVEEAAREREIYRLKSEGLERELLNKSRELTSMALRLVERGEVLDTVKAGLRQVLMVQNGSAHPLLHAVLRQVDTSAHADIDWSAFESQFTQVHPDFIRNLSERHPQLTPAELKICALMKINLSTKEMANLLCLSVRNIENHRYRIRKKLGLDPAASLGSHIASL
jgi:tetratricopeptide (TPR) repeat protein/DNA-binding CsgD family transcriptional regulator